MTTPAVIGKIGPAPAETWSDDALALLFTERYGDFYRYLARFKQWRRWTTSVWVEDDTLRVFDLIRGICREVATELKGLDARRVTSAQTVAAVERLARTDAVHMATADQWDADPMLLNTPGGVVELERGTLRPSRPADFCTKQTLVAPGGDCPRWQAVLAQATDHNQAYVDFLQRWFGYCATGSTREQSLVFGFGTGANSKGTIVNTVAQVMGSYARVAPIATFAATSFDRHPADLAMLWGARLVTAQETEEGRRWDAQRIKSLTGGDPVTARFMRQDFFTYQPQFKLTIFGNHRPSLQHVDEAMRRRLIVAPFLVTIPKADRDLELGAKLIPEYPGILAWLIDGCVRWQREGLNPPPAVTDTTDAYFETEDTIATWLSECCRARPGLLATTRDLFNSWRQWAEAAGEAPGSAKMFSERLQGKGFERKRIGHRQDRGFSGLCLEFDHEKKWQTDAD